ncbi:hypothetical protein ACQUW5_05445 [Legionella sp. CNM-1927-20]|uniref:hypothetical protein n=1 Tax=Legionella sp. CNM-1927-20 TaxID=3422221 RepID=UPI00403B372C
MAEHKTKEKINNKDGSKSFKKRYKNTKDNKSDSPALVLDKLTVDPLRPMEGAAELAEKVKNDLALSGTNNELTQKQFLGADMGNLLGNGVPGYQTTGVEHPINEVQNHIEAKKNPGTR